MSIPETLTPVLRFAVFGVLGAALVGAGPAAASPVAAPAEEQTWEAHITDSMCGTEHMMDGMSDPECAVACREMGADYALFVPVTEAVYQIANQEKVEEFAGTDVVVTGTLSDDGSTVTVASISARPEEPSE